MDDRNIGHLTSIHVLAHVLREARTLVGRSPEHVADVAGVSGKTIRRLESASLRAPRYVTLEALGRYYALDPGVLSQLAAWGDRSGRELIDGIRRLAGRDDLQPEELVEAAMAAARRGGALLVVPREVRRDPDVLQLVQDFLALDRGRRALARAILTQLRMARERR